MSYVLLIIDPQVDFHEGGNLAVTGATKDSENIVRLIQGKTPAKVFVSLDTHTPTHIGHPDFWSPSAPSNTIFHLERASGAIVKIQPDDPTKEQLAADTVANHMVEYSKAYTFQEGDRVMGSDGIEYTPAPTGKGAEVDDALKTWVLKYIAEVPSYGKGDPLIWPVHCVEGSEGHKVHPLLKSALDSLSAKGVPVEYHVKGQNEATEMYSIFKAEMPAPMDLYRGPLTPGAGSLIASPNSDEADHANLQTTFNQELYNSLMSHNLPIVVCGEALSHCVNWSTRDLNEKRKTDNPDAKIHLLEDASSMVVLPFAPDLFRPNTEAFLKYCDDNGVTRIKTDAFLAMAGGRRRKTRRNVRARKTRRNRRFSRRR